MATIIIISSISASSLSFRSQTASLLNLPSSSQSKGIYVRNSFFLRLNCSSEQSRKESEEDVETKTVSSSSSSTSYHSVIRSGISAYNWSAGLGGLGFLETAYLTYLKLSNSNAFCPFGADEGGACGGILNSPYSLVFGIPLPLIGMVAYGAVAVLGLQLGGKKLPFKIGETTSRSILLVTTTSMAAASAYFLYILNTQFPQESCIYCLASALLSFCLFFTTTKDLWSKETQKVVTLQLFTALLVVSALSTSYSFSEPVSSSSAEVNLPYFETNVTTESTPLAISLARHLHSVGAKLYGAFWCSHCQEQKEMFGREAAKILDYVECFPDGYRKGTKMAKACIEGFKIEGFPTWTINGQVLSGEQDFSELASAAGIKLEDLGQAN